MKESKILGALISTIPEHEPFIKGIRENMDLEKLVQTAIKSKKSSAATGLLF